ncbi:substrate-binding periplasmic protein [Silanimonas algicola]
MPGLAAGAAPSSPPNAVVRVAGGQDSATQAVATSILIEAYARAGLVLRVDRLPAPRAAQRLEAGLLDGEVARVPAYFDQHPDLVPVGPPLMQVPQVAFVRSGSGIRVNTLDDLRGLRVGVVRGLLQSERLVAGLDRVTRVTSGHQLYQMLAAGRLDVVVDAPMNQAMHVGEWRLTGIVAQATLSDAPVYHGLHRRRAAIAPRVAAALEAMRASGELAAWTSRPAVVPEVRLAKR